MQDAVDGIVREWHSDEGWGVVDSLTTPGGCWVHFSHVAVAGYRSLVAGQAVSLEYETGGQDGYSYRALRVWPAGTAPVEATVDPTARSDVSAYRSTLTLRFDDPPGP